VAIRLRYNKSIEYVTEVDPDLSRAMEGLPHSRASLAYSVIKAISISVGVIY